MVSLYKRRTNDEKRNHNHWREWKGTYPDCSRLDVGLRNSLLVRRILQQGERTNQNDIQRRTLLLKQRKCPLHKDSFMKLSDMGFIIVLAFYFQPLGTRVFHQRGDVRTKRVYTHILVFIYVTNYSAK